jgi:hypothetical protein
MWLCPFGGGISAASFLTLNNLPYPPCGHFVCSAWNAFGLYLIRDTVLGYYLHCAEQIRPCPILLWIPPVLRRLRNQ